MFPWLYTVGGVVCPDYKVPIILSNSQIISKCVKCAFKKNTHKHRRTHTSQGLKRSSWRGTWWGEEGLFSYEHGDVRFFCSSFTVDDYWKSTSESWADDTGYNYACINNGLLTSVHIIHIYTVRGVMEPGFTLAHLNTDSSQSLWHEKILS